MVGKDRSRNRDGGKASLGHFPAQPGKSGKRIFGRVEYVSSFGFRGDVGHSRTSQTEDQVRLAERRGSESEVRGVLDLAGGVTRDQDGSHETGLERGTTRKTDVVEGVCRRPRKRTKKFRNQFTVK